MFSLSPGFEAKAGSEFTARIENCNDFSLQRPISNAQKNETVKHINQVFAMYPNPASNQVNVEWHQDEVKLSRLYITDMMGRMLMEILPTQKMNAGTVQVQLFAKQLANGTYFIHLISGNERHVSKLVVQH